jgi:putative peptidoglycan lipid II flippase
VTAGRAFEAQQKIWSGAGLYAVASLFVKAAALIKEMLTAAFFGVHWSVDVFVLAWHAVNTPAQIVMGSLQTAFIPAYADAARSDAARESNKAAQALAAKTIRNALIWGVAGAASILALAPLLARSIGGRLAVERIDYLTAQIAFLAPYLAVSGAVFILQGILQSRKRLFLSGLLPVCIPLATVFFFLIHPSGGAWILAAGVLSGILLECLLSSLAAGFAPPRFAGLAPREASAVSPSVPLSTPLPGSDLDRRHKNMRTQWLALLPASILMSTTPFVDVMMAAFLGDGAVATLNYGQRVPSLVMSLATLPLGAAMLPHLAELVSLGEWQVARRVLRRIVLVILAVSIPATLLLVAGSDLLAALLWQRGALADGSVGVVSRVQQAYLLQIPFALAGIAGARFISAAGRNHLLARITVVNFVLNIALNLLFMRWFHVSGIALATAVMYAVSAALILLAVRSLPDRREVFQ